MNIVLCEFVLHCRAVKVQILLSSLPKTCMFAVYCLPLDDKT